MATPFSKDTIADYSKVLLFPKDAAFQVPGASDKKMVWVPYDSDFGYAKGELLKEEGDKRHVKLETGEEKTFSSKEVEECNPAKFEGVEDMSELGYLNAPSVLYNLKRRYDHDLIYTYSGLFLVAINPYKHLPIYTQNIVETYCGKRRNEVAPHIFAISDTAYRAMLTDHRDQSLLITGESGAGKTENTKKVIQYIASIAGRAGGQGKLEQQLIQLNPFLEAFGNAKTCRNNNSSRFGKFIKLEFNHAGNVAGASLESYLLEKSRIVSQASGERNYHIFYQLISGATQEEKSKYHLKGAEQYNFLNKSGCYSVERMNDVKEFELTKAAMETCDIGPEYQDNIYKVIAAILWLGNLPFVSGSGEGAELKGKEELNIAAELLAVEPQALEDALIKPCIIAGRDRVQTHLSATQASDSRDALVKALYGRLFLWLVQRINEVLSCSSSASFIGVLDISGFEIFQENSFEQLCINYTNERLQQFFNNHMFKLEQDEYEAEKINWSRVDFKIDGQSTIDLIDRKPNGILITLDEESVFPNATDETFLHKLYGKHQHNPAFQKPRFAGSQTFIIKHYAGEVEYSVEKWLEKNKDPLQNDLETCIKSSSNRFVAGLFAPALAAGGGSSVSTSERKKGAQFLTVGNAYKEQLGSLMTTLQSTSPHFVRCILPNHKQRPGIIESNIVLEQLRCNGVLEGIRITRMGFPNRQKYAEFLKRYYLLAPDVPRTAADPKGECQKIIKHLQVPDDKVQFGLTKIFFRTGQLARIEELRESKIGELLVVIQAAARGWVARNTYRKLTAQTQAARIIQSNLRNHLDFKDWLWWNLFQKARPLLKRRNFEAEMAERETALKETAEKLKQEQEEREALANQLKDLKGEMSSLNDKFRESEESINNLTREKAQLENQKNELEADLEDERAIAQDLAQVKSSLEEKTRELKSALDEEQAEREDLGEKLKSLSTKFEELQKNLEERDAKISSLESESSTLRTKLQDAEFELESKEDGLEALSQKESSLKKNLAAIKGDLEESEDKAQALATQKAALESKLKKLQSDYDTEIEAKVNSDATASKIRDQLNSTQAQLDEQTQLGNTLSKAKKDLEKKLSQLEGELEDALSNASDLESAKKTLTSKVAELEEKNQEDLEALEELEEKQRKNDLTIADLRKRLADAEATIANLERQKKALQTRVTELETQLEEEQKDKAALAREKQTLTDEIDALNSQLDNEGQNQSTLGKKLKKAEKENKILTEKLREESDARDDAQNELGRLTAEMGSLRNDFEESEGKIRALNNRKRELEASLEEMKDQVDSLTSANDALKKQVNNFKNEADELNLNLTEQTDLAEESQAEVARLKRELAGLQGDINLTQDEAARNLEANKSLKQQFDELDAYKNSVESKTQALEKAKLKAESDARDIQLRLDDETAKCTALDRKNKKLAKKNSALASEMENKLALLKTDLEGQLNTTKEELRVAQESLEQSMKTQREAKQEKDELSRKILDIQAQLDEALNAKTRLERQNRALQDEMENLSEEIESNVMDKFEEMKSKHNRELSELRAELDTQQGNARAFEDKHRNATAEAETIRGQLEAETARASNLDRELSAAKAAAEDARRQYDDQVVATSNADKQNKKLQKAINKLKQDLVEAENRVPESELKRVNDMVDDLQRQLEDEKKAKQLADREKDSLNSELNNLRLELEEEQRAKQTATSNAKKAAFERDDLQTRLEEEEEEAEAARARVSKLTGDLEAARRAATEAEDNARNLESKVSSLEASVSKLTADLSNEQRVRSEAETAGKRARDEADTAQSELETERSAKAKADSAAKKYKKNASALQNTLTTTEAELREAQSKARIAEEELNSIREQLDSESRSRATLEAEMSGKDESINSLNAQVSELTSAKQTAENNLKRARLEHEDILGRLEDEEANADQMRSEKTIAEQRLNEARNNLRVAEEEKTRLEGSLRDAIADAQALRSQLQTLEQDKNAIEKKARDLQAAADEARMDAENQQRAVAKAERSKKKAEKQINLAREEADRERQSRSQEATKASSLDSELRNLKSRLSDAENQNLTTQSKVKKLEQDLASRDRENKALKTQLDEAREDLERERKRQAERKRKMASMFD